MNEVVPGGPGRRAGRPHRGHARRRQPGRGGGAGRPAAVPVDGERRAERQAAAARGPGRRVDLDEVPAPAAWPEPDPASSRAVVHADDDRDRGRQAGRAGRAPRRRQPRRHAGQRPAGPLPRTGRRRPIRSGPASSTASTRAPRGLLVVARTDAAYAALVAQLAARTRRAARTWRWCGACPRPAAAWSTRRSGARPATRPGWRCRPTGRPARTALRGRARLRRPGRAGAAARAGWRRAAPTRSGSTSPPSTTRWWATPATAAPRPAWSSTRPFLHAAAPGLRPPGDRRARCAFDVAVARRPGGRCSTALALTVSRAAGVGARTGARVARPGALARAVAATSARV